MTALRQAWHYLASQGVGTTPEQRLLALVCVCRAAGQGDRAGRVNLTSRDLAGPLALVDPAGALDGLLASGWMSGPREALLDGDPCRAVEFRLRNIADGGVRPIDVPEKLRSRMSGLAQRVLGCRRLRQLPAEIRLAAAYLTAHVGPEGRGAAGLGDLAAACLVDRATVAAAVAALVETGLVTGHESGDGRLLYHLRDELAPADGPGCLPGPRQHRPGKRPGRRRAHVPKPDGDTERALACPMCDHPDREGSVPAQRRPAFPGRSSLTGRQAAVLQAALATVARTAPDLGADVRLAALWCATRALWAGELAMTRLRIGSIPVPGAAECLRQLTAAGWLRLDSRALAAATGADPELVAVPSMAVRTEALDIGRASADYVASWQCRLLISAPLAAAASASRLVAIHFLAHSDVLHRAETSVEDLQLLLGSGDGGQVKSAVAGLHRIGWLGAPPVFEDGRVRVVLGAGATPFAPTQTPVHATATPPFPDPQMRARAATLVEDRARDWRSGWPSTAPRTGTGRLGGNCATRTFPTATLSGWSPSTMRPSGCSSRRAGCRGSAAETACARAGATVNAATPSPDPQRACRGQPAPRRRHAAEGPQAPADVLWQFFGFARSQHLILVDPTHGLTAKETKGYRGRPLTLDQQRDLFRRWTCDDKAHPHEALLGMLALLHGASSAEIRILQVNDIDPAARTVRLGKRPHPIPLDPASWTLLQRCLAHRAAWSTENPHVMVTKRTKVGRSAASTAYLSHVLDDYGHPPRMVRGTRLVDLVNTMDRKLVAAAFGMDPQAALFYLADHVDAGRLPER
ncbi:hypothetical protein ACWCXH_31795 [Kitasatospora sp. NPDC001660]